VAASLTDLKRQLTQVPETKWRLSAQRDGSAVEWLPLLSISQSSLWLGLGMDGEWVLGRQHGSITPSPTRAGLSQAWLTLLDSSETEFRIRLSSASARHRLSVSILQDRLPIDDIITMALRSQSRHWSERAVRWLETRPLAEEHLSLLQELASSRWATQGSRHTARACSELRSREGLKAA
jgi:hypothetical protein